MTPLQPHDPTLPTLYHAPRTCSQAVLIAAREIGVDLNVTRVSLQTKLTDTGDDFQTINPLGQVSTLTLPDGTMLTETATVLMWVQSHSVTVKPNSPDYFQILRWVGFCATELHKQLFRIVFYDEATDSVKDNFRTLSHSRLDVLSNHLSDKEYLVGTQFSAADAYLIWVTLLLGKAGVPLTNWPVLTRYSERLCAKESIAQTIAQDLI